MNTLKKRWELFKIRHVYKYEKYHKRSRSFGMYMYIDQLTGKWALMIYFNYTSYRISFK